eukprot:TRINITY_DN1955_c0_g3_i1.p1 TRINITY_DN1955_c0_g3~~TRINITY_DN1955_c0_g3_i1.p1  ORF type:complete len:414 (-),score=56.77 TRINITY_DN1955_c0_g3_i1:107-1294(-)
MPPRAKAAPPRAPSRRNSLTSSVAIVREVVSESAKACWELRGVSMMQKERGKIIRSGILVEAAGGRFGIQLNLGGATNTEDGRSSIFCYRSDDPSNNNIHGTYAFTVFGVAGSQNVQEKPSDNKVFTPQGMGSTWGKINFLQTDLLLSPRFVLDDTLVIELSVTMWTPDKERVLHLPAAPGSSGRCSVECDSRNGGDLAGDWGAVLDSNIKSDVQVRGSLMRDGQKACAAHRLVLSARSVVFRRMLLESGMREGEAGSEVCLDGVEQAVADIFVRFLYTDALSEETVSDPDCLCHLLALGHRFEVKSLVRLCLSHIKVTEETAVERLIMAEQLSLSDLKQQVMDYMCSNRKRLAAIQKTEDFKRLGVKYPSLLMDLFAQVTEPSEKRARVSECSS